MATIFNPYQANKDKENQQSTTAGTPTSNLNMGQQPQNQRQRQGSGRFTNLQQYLQANQQGGQRLAQGIGQQAEKNVAQDRSQSEEYASKVAEGIQKAQGTLQSGKQNLEQLQQIGTNIKGQTGSEYYAQPKDLGIQAFTQSPGYDQFQQIQRGQGIDENTLALQQQISQNAANRYLQQAQDYSGMIGNEAGRFDLLKRTYGGDVNPQYTKGQQSLDQLFLARQGTQPLKQQFGENLQQAQMMTKVGLGQQQGVQNVTQAERQIMQDLKSQGLSNEEAYVQMLESYVPEINRLREQEFQNLQGTLSAVGQQFSPAGSQQKATPTGPQDIDYDALRRLGLSGSQQVYNVFDQLKAEDVAARGREAAGYRDVASQEDLDRYNALAQIAGMSDYEKRLTDVADLGAAWEARRGETDEETKLQSLINQAAKSFATEAAGKNYNEFWRGGKKSFASVGANLADLLAGGNIGATEKRGAAQSSVLADRILKQAMDDLGKAGYGNVLNLDEGFAQNVLPSNVSKNWLGGGRVSGSRGSTLAGAAQASLANLGLAPLGGVFGHRSSIYGQQYGTNLNQQLADALAAAGIKNNDVKLQQPAVAEPKQQGILSNDPEQMKQVLQGLAPALLNKGTF